MPHWLSRLHSWQRPQISHLKAYGWAPLWRAGKSWDGGRMLCNWRHPKIIAWQTALLDGHCVACLRTAARTGEGNVGGARLKASDSAAEEWLTLRPSIIFCAWLPIGEDRRRWCRSTSGIRARDFPHSKSALEATMPNLQIVVKKLPKKDGDEQRFAVLEIDPQSTVPLKRAD